MSAASPASAQPRRTMAAAPQVPAAQALRNSAAFAFSVPSGEDEIRLHLADIPRLEETMDVEGLKPTLLSRLFDLILPISSR
jgi:hypothetical protein